MTFRGTWTEFIGLARIAYHCPISATCYLNGWIDWDGNSQFDLEDWIVTNKDVSGTGTTEYSFTIPTDTNVEDGRVFHARFRIYSAYPGDAPLPNGQATDVSGQPTVGEVEDYEITLLGGTPIHTPVTLSYFKAVRNGTNVTFNWSTATETGNMGFNLYAGDETERTLINPEVIGSKVVDSLNRQDYTYTTTVTGNTFFLEDVSVVDEARVHGPFQLGKEYGDRTQNDVIDWNLIQVENSAKDTKRQRNLAPGLTITNNTKAPTSALNFEVNKTGIYRVTYETLKAAGYDLEGVPDSKNWIDQQWQSCADLYFWWNNFWTGFLYRILRSSIGHTLHRHEYLYVATQYDETPSGFSRITSVSRKKPFTQNLSLKR